MPCYENGGLGWMAASSAYRAAADGMAEKRKFLAISRTARPAVQVLLLYFADCIFNADAV